MKNSADFIVLKFAVLLLPLILGTLACAPTRFAPVSSSTEMAATPPSVEPPPNEPQVSKLSDLLLHTEMNVPIDFTAQATLADDSVTERTIAITPDNILSSIKTKHGRIEILDGATFKLRYTPGRNFRGEDTLPIFLIEDRGRRIAGAMIRIQVDNPLVTLKPALAVRGTGCIMCHSSIASNVITDFGYGSPYFFGGSKLAPTDMTSIYADENTDPAWKYVKRLGEQVIVPQAPTTSLSKVGAPSLAAYLSKVVSSSPLREVNQTQVNEVASVYIGAPSAARILEVAQMNDPADSSDGSGQAGTPERVKYMPDFAQSSVLPSLIHKTTNGTDVYTNDESSEFICSGDLVIDGVVFLKNLVIQSNTGCRIYATRSVFISGPITYSGGDPRKRNLQIVSARSINLGLGDNTCRAPLIGSNSLNHRLKEEVRRQYFFTRGEPEKSVQTKLDDILTDAALVGKGALLDAACEPKFGRAVDFERLILNAPIVFSRYTGGFRGSIIAEIALMSLSKFVFEFDPVFSNQVVLPLLSPNDYLTVK